MQCGRVRAPLAPKLLPGNLQEDNCDAANTAAVDSIQSTWPTTGKKQSLKRSSRNSTKTRCAQDSVWPLLPVPVCLPRAKKDSCALTSASENRGLADSAAGSRHPRVGDGLFHGEVGRQRLIDQFCQEGVVAAAPTLRRGLPVAWGVGKALAGRVR